MKHKRFGFTLVEVMLFLAISGILMLSVFGMTRNSIMTQRFNDSVQSFAEFLRRAYSAVANPQSIGDGRSDYAIYGKLITFGEKRDLSGNLITGRQEFFMYDVIGNSETVGSSDIISTLKAIDANVVMITKGANGVYDATRAGIVESFTPTWGAAIDGIKNGTPFTGSILIVRHPRSGTIGTLVSNSAVKVNETIASGNIRSIMGILQNELNNFTVQTVNFCVNPEGYEIKSNVRRNVRIIANARNASGVELIEQDGNDNECKTT